MYSDGVKIIKKLFGAAVTTFEYLCDYANRKQLTQSHFLLVGIYRSGSQTVGSTPYLQARQSSGQFFIL